jgi:selenium metabolism protein YedF
MNLIDARKMSCPKPVLETKKFLDENPGVKQISVVVDNMASLENVSRFLSNQGFEVKTNKDKDDFQINGLKKNSEPESDHSDEDEFLNTKTLVMIANDYIGSGDLVLGRKLMENFISTLNEYQGLWMIIFLNSGVKLTVKGSNVLDDLKKYEKSGIKILVCGTCLDYYGLLESKQAGETTNMLDVVASLNLADKIISI